MTSMQQAYMYIKDYSLYKYKLEKAYFSKSYFFFDRRHFFGCQDFQKLVLISDKNIFSFSCIIKQFHIGKTLKIKKKL